MKKDVIIVNNFYENPEEVIRYAMSLKYYNPWARNQMGSSAPEDMVNTATRVSFFKKAKECPFKSSKEFIGALEKITGEEIDLDHWNKDFPENPEDGTELQNRFDLIDPNKKTTFDNLVPNAVSCRWNCVFQVKHIRHQKNELIHNHVRDTWNSVGLSGWTGLIYLNKDAPRDAGLATYKNIKGDHYEWMSAPENWELVDDYANVYNRLILLRGLVPHVGAAGWGNTLKNGRLYQTLFFKTKPTEDLADGFTFRPNPTIEK